MRKLSDAQVRAALRAVLTRHRVDLTGLTIQCAGGTIRLLGSLKHAGFLARFPLRMQEMETLDQEVQHLPGVSRVHYDLRNWRRSDSGAWTFVNQAPASVGRPAANESFSMREF